MAAVKFGYTIIYVDDVVKTMDFYKSAFGLAERFIHETNTYGELETGKTLLAFAADSLAETHGFAYRRNSADQDPAGIEIGLVTDNVEALYDRACELGAERVSAPEEKPWGQTVAYVRDLNGCLIELCTEIPQAE